MTSLINLHLNCTYIDSECRLYISIYFQRQPYRQKYFTRKPFCCANMASTSTRTLPSCIVTWSSKFMSLYVLVGCYATIISTYLFLSLLMYTVQPWSTWIGFNVCLIVFVYMCSAIVPLTMTAHANHSKELCRYHSESVPLAMWIEHHVIKLNDIFDFIDCAGKRMKLKEL